MVDKDSRTQTSMNDSQFYEEQKKAQQIPEQISKLTAKTTKNDNEAFLVPNRKQCKY